MQVELSTSEVKDMNNILNAFCDIAPDFLTNYVYGSIIIEGDKYTIPFRTFDISNLFTFSRTLESSLRYYDVKYNFSKIEEDGIEKYECEMIFYR